MNDLRLYTDKYFLSSQEILKKENLNPRVKTQVFIRIGPGKIYGINEAINIIKKFTKNTSVYSLPEGSGYKPLETLMILKGPIQEIIVLETVVLGIISSLTTKANDNIDIDLKKVKQRMQTIVELVKPRPVYYFGARHWHWSWDDRLSQAAISAGASGRSTGKNGVGTIPHSLECIMDAKFGKDKAVLESIKAFDKWIDKKVPRIALVDYQNKEIDDALLCAKNLGDRLSGIRIDTPGENVMQGAKNNQKGVSISGVKAVREALDNAGFDKVKIMLSSGFGDPQKVKEFIKAENRLGMKLFDSLGVGGIFYSRQATMDIVYPKAKAGRKYKPNKRLKRLL